MFERFEELPRRKNQRFICIDTGWPQPGPVRHTALIKHDVGPPVDSATLGLGGRANRWLAGNHRVLSTP
jgi:hypothetical protein